MNKKNDARNARSDIRNNNNEMSSLIGGTSKNRPVKALDFMGLKLQNRGKNIKRSQIDGSIDSFSDIKQKYLNV